VLGYIVKFEPPHTKREVRNALADSNTKGFCNRKARCIKCAGDHPISNCPHKVKSKNIKCVLCKSNHSTNYKGYTVYKDLQKRHFHYGRRKEQPNHNHRSNLYAYSRKLSTRQNLCLSHKNVKHSINCESNLSGYTEQRL